MDGIHLAQQPADLVAGVSRKVGADPAVEVGGLADVEDVAGGIGEPVDAGPVGEPDGQPELRGLRVPDHLGQVEQFFQSHDPEGSRSFQQRMEQVAGGQDVGERPVRGLVGEVECGRQGTELAVGDHVTDQTPGQGEGVDGGVGQAVPAGRFERVVEEGEVESDVVPHDHRPTEELEERREHLAGPRGVRHHGIADAGQRRDERRDPLVGSNEGLVRPEQLAPSVAGRRHLGERGGGRRAPGGLDVEDHERDLAERGAEVVEGPLDGECHCSTVANGCSSWSDGGARRRDYRYQGDHRLDCHHERPRRHRCRPLPLFRLWEPHPVQRGDLAAHSRVPPLFGGRGPDDRGRRSARRVRRRGVVPLVRKRQRRRGPGVGRVRPRLTSSDARKRKMFRLLTLVPALRP